MGTVSETPSAGQASMQASRLPAVGMCMQKPEFQHPIVGSEVSQWTIVLCGGLLSPASEVPERLG